jgi:hypothetical protein
MSTQHRAKRFVASWSLYGDALNYNAADSAANLKTLIGWVAEVMVKTEETRDYFKNIFRFTGNVKI